MAIKIQHELHGPMSGRPSRAVAAVQRWLRRVGGAFVDWVTGDPAAH